MSGFKTSNKVKLCILTIHNGAQFDFTAYLNMPIVYEPVLDETLDSANITLSDIMQKDFQGIDLSRGFEPFSKMEITFEDENGGQLETKISMFVFHDDVKSKRKDNTKWKSYTHKLLLIEQTKLLERYSVDTLTFTNPIPRNYDPNAYSEWSVTNEETSTF